MNKIWNKIQTELKNIQEPIGQTLSRVYIEKSNSLTEAIIEILSQKLADQVIIKAELSALFHDSLAQNQSLEEVFSKDLEVYFQRDFACEHYFEVLLFFRGYQALAAYRFAHLFHQEGKNLTAKYLQNRIFEAFAIDIHPAAQIGVGLVIDHGIGVVIGETCKIENNVFIFHNVTLGGTGKSSGDRHPKIHANVVIGAGATILGNITIGEGANIAAGAVVLKDVPPQTTVAGIPAQIKGKANKVQ